MGVKSWLERQAPDFVDVWRRFPLAIAMTVLLTAIVLGAFNEVMWLRHEVWARAAAGLGTGAIFAVAGVYFTDSRPEAKRLGLVLNYLLPFVAIATFQITDIAWFVPYALPVIAVLWLSVSPFTRIERGAARDEQQKRFWLVNHQAAATAAIAAVAFAIIALGFFAIERSLSILFGLDTARVFYQWLLPTTGLLLSPVYWLSTLPKLDAINLDETERPEFISKAIGFLGQFVLVPLLFIYALILLAYTGLIVVNQKLPEGMIGWMVMGFVIVGAATWLVLYPPFMRDKPLVKLFRRLWFWLTLVPLGLFFAAVWVRLDAYGLTSERQLLLGGGIWAASLAAVFLFGRGDIRLIPTLAGGILLLLSVGPWNYAYLPVQQQLLRLDTLVMNAGADKSLSPPRSDWSGDDIAEARNIIDYLGTTAQGRRGVRQVMGRYGVTWAADTDGSYAVLDALGQSREVAENLPRYTTVWRDLSNQPVDVSATPYLLRPLGIYADNTIETSPRFTMKAGVLSVGPTIGDDTTMVPLDLTAWLAAQDTSSMTNPWIDFTIGGHKYRYALTSMTFDLGEDNLGPRALSSLDGVLFSEAPPTPSP